MNSTPVTPVPAPLVRSIGWRGFLLTQEVKDRIEAHVPKPTEHDTKTFDAPDPKKLPHFASWEEQIIDDASKPKTCTKCKETKWRIQFNTNCSGSDKLDRHRILKRRPECSACTKKGAAGKRTAQILAKTIGVSYKAPQGTKCTLCNDARRPPGESLVFDHCHEKNVFRGYLCNMCNRSLGGLGDNANGLVNALNFLLKTSEKKIAISSDGKSVSVID